jgi:glutaredoxin
MVKRWLQSKNLAYEEINLDEKPELRAEAMRISGGMTVPVTVVTKSDDSQDVIVGWNLAKLAPAVS